MNLAAAAGHAGVLLEGRLEGQAAKMHALESDLVHAQGKLVAVEPGRADQLEGARGAAPFRQHVPS